MEKIVYIRRPNMTLYVRIILCCFKMLLEDRCTVYPKKYAHGFCFAVLCCGYTLTDFPISIRLTSLALWQSNDCPSASKATLMNMDKYFMWIHYERLHNHNKAKHNKTVCIFLGIYCIRLRTQSTRLPSASRPERLLLHKSHLVSDRQNNSDFHCPTGSIQHLQVSLTVIDEGWKNKGNLSDISLKRGPLTR